MNPESPSIETQKTTLEHHGIIPLSAEEQARLHQELEQEFSPHPTFSGVEIKPIETSALPASIQKLVESIHGTVTAFMAVRITKEIPLHQHTTDGEIYFNGEDATVTLLDASKQEIGQFDLRGNFTMTMPGEWHSISTTNENGTTFFSTKFKQD